MQVWLSRGANKDMRKRLWLLASRHVVIPAPTQGIVNLLLKELSMCEVL